MISRFFFGFFALAAFMIPIAAAPEPPDIAHGNGLLQACTSTATIDKDICFGYIQGASDALQYANAIKPFCYPSSVTMGQIMDAVVKFLKDHPEKRHLYSPELMEMALREAFPCPSN